MSGVELVPLAPSHLPALRAAWQTVFARERSLESFTWSARAPAGDAADTTSGPCGYVALHEERVVAHYGVVRARAWVAGAARDVGCVVDSFVDPRYRAGLKRPGLFVELARAFFSVHGGEERLAFCYGWPLPAARRIGEHFLEYTPLRRELVLSRACDAPPLPLVPDGLVLEELTTFDHQALWLWERCAHELPASTIRDARWLTWRYLEHPTHRYRVFGVRDAQAHLRGLAVQRTAELGLPQVGVIVDWLVPSAEPEVAHLLAHACMQAAQRDRATACAVLVPPWSPWFAWFQDEGFEVRESEWIACARSWSRVHDVDWWRAHWWSTFGDGDLV